MRNPVFILFFVLFGCQASPDTSSSPVTQIPNRISVLPAWPESLVVCGIRLPVEDQEIRERFEREFYTTLHNENLNLQTVMAGNKLLPVLKKLIREEGLPEDLVYLAIAESNLRFVSSPAGATGLWQLMEFVARGEDLRINYWVDERNHTEKSTRAALSLIKKLKRKYQDWNLVFAAYNVGEGNIDDNLKFQNVTSFFDLYLNEETSRYIFRVYAAKAIFESPGKWGLPAWDFREPEGGTETVKGPVQNLAAFALERGVSYRDLRLANPWMKRRGLPDGTYLITVPSVRKDKTYSLNGYSYTKLKAVDNLAAGTVSHEVKEGETLLSIALQYDVETDEIKKWNNLKTEMLMTGQKLKIVLK